MTDDEIGTLVARLSRPHISGGRVIERAAILAEGGDSPAILNWILAHAGRPEAAVPRARGRGLHGARMTDGVVPPSREPMRYVIPAGRPGDTFER